MEIYEANERGKKPLTCVGNLAEIKNRKRKKSLGCTLSNLVEYNTYENGILTLFHYEIHTIYIDINRCDSSILIVATLQY